MTTSSRSLRSRICLLLTTAALLPSSPLALAAGEAKGPASTPPPSQFTAPGKPYALFMGNNLAIEHAKQYYSLLNVTGSDMVIKVNGQAKLIPLQQLGSFKFEHALRLSHVAVRVDSLVAEQAYTPDNDPQAQQMQQMMLNSNMAQDAGDAALRSEVRHAEALAAVQRAGDVGGSPGAADAKAALSQAANDNLKATMKGPSATGPAYSTGVGSTDHQGFDAIDVTFSITAPMIIEHAYYLFIADYKVKGDMKGEGHKFIHAAELGPIGPEPTRFHFKRGGLPAGYELGNHEFHVYQNARELASNLSDKRVDMTRENVETYLLVSHLGEHKGATLAASAVRLPNPAAPKIQLSRAKLLEPVFIRVGTKGNVLRVSADAGGTQDASGDAIQALRDFIFLPALEKGVPVESVLRLNLLEHL